MSNSEDTVSLSDQEIKESIQKEISKSPKISGVMAQDVCSILDLECSSQTSFNAVFDQSDGYTKFSYTKKSVTYSFRTMDDTLEYKSSENNGEWRTLEDDYVDIFYWDDSFREDVDIVEPNRPHTFHFDSDKLGNYEKWCSNFNGTFYPSMTDSKVGCAFTSENAASVARDGLRKLQEKTITGELAQRLCAAYGKQCEPGIFITMEYDMETGDLYKLKRNEDISSGHFYTEYRIIDDDVIQYRYPTGHASSGFPWNTFEE